VAINKGKLLDMLRARVEAKLEGLIASQSTVQSGAIHEENRQEHPKDTRAIEAGYLARGLAERVESTADAVAALAAFRVRDFDSDDPIALSAVVGLEDVDGIETLYFLVPAAGGETLDCNGTSVYTIAPEAPIGRALIGRFVDDEVSLELPSGLARLTVVRMV
jgi:transcription elongation GreA/GreB family factor